MPVDPRCWRHTHIHREPHIHMQHACAEGCNCCTVAAQILLQMAIDTRATDTRYTGYTRYMRYPRVRNGECFACAGGFWNLVYATPCRRPRFPSPLSLSLLAQQCANLVSEMILPSSSPPALAQLEPDINMLCKIYALHAATATGTGSALMPHFYFR